MVSKTQLRLEREEFDKRMRALLKCHERILKDDPNDVLALVNRGSKLLYFERYDEALKSLNKAIKLNPRERTAWLNRGDALLAKGWHEKNGSRKELYEEAIRCFNHAATLDPDVMRDGHDPRARIPYIEGKAVALGLLEIYGEALGFLNYITEIAPEYYHAWVSTGKVLKMMGKNKEAEECFKLYRKGKKIF